MGWRAGKTHAGRASNRYENRLIGLWPAEGYVEIPLL